MDNGKQYIIKFPCPTRGFFGIYLEAIRCIDFAVTNKLPFYADLAESNSLYSDTLAFNGNTNVWEYYFDQEKYPGNEAIFSTSKYEGCIDKIWIRTHLKRVHKRAVQHLKYNRAMQAILDERKRTFPIAAIGVHIRKTDHSTEVPQVPFEAYTRLLQKRIKAARYKYIFLSTDDTTVAGMLKMIFPDTEIICNAVTRSANGEPVHKNESFINKFQLGAEAILDAYSLSLCKEVILSNSNLSYCALYMNPDIKFHLLDGFQTRKLFRYFRDVFWSLRYVFFHQLVFIQWHRKCRYFIQRFKRPTTTEIA